MGSFKPDGRGGGFFPDGAGGGGNYATGTVTTVDATPTVALTYTPPSDSAEIITVMVSGMRADAGLGAGYIFFKFVRVTGGVMTLTGGTAADITNEEAGAAAWTAVVGTSGASLTVTVTGAAATTIRWVAAIASRVRAL